MNFVEALKEAIGSDLKLIRRKKWPDGVACSVGDKLSFQHVTACALPVPPTKDFLADDWIVVVDWGKDISYDWR